MKIKATILVTLICWLSLYFYNKIETKNKKQKFTQEMRSNTSSTTYLMATREEWNSMINNDSLDTGNYVVYFTDVDLIHKTYYGDVIGHRVLKNIPNGASNVFIGTELLEL